MNRRTPRDDLVRGVLATFHGEQVRRLLAGDTAVACAKNVFRPKQIDRTQRRGRYGYGRDDRSGVLGEAVTQSRSGCEQWLHRLAA